MMRRSARASSIRHSASARPARSSNPLAASSLTAWAASSAIPITRSTCVMPMAPTVFPTPILDNRLGIELAYDFQRYHNGQVSGGPGNIQIDLNTNLIDGSPNPNVGRPYVDTGSSYGNNSYATKRNDFRVTAFGNLNFTDFMSKSLLTDILGRHVFTALYSTDQTLSLIHISEP